MSRIPDVAVVITTFDVHDLLVRCLDSLGGASGSLKIEVVVVDNGFCDGTWQMLLARKNVKAIRGSSELGFGRANNIGAVATCAPLILFLNPDTELEDGSIQVLAERLGSRLDVATVGPRLILPSGRLDPASSRNFPSLASAIHRFLGAPRVFGLDVDKPYNTEEVATTVEREVDSVSGACFLIRRTAFDAVGGFDQRYFMYGDDLDLHRRLADLGWRTLCVHEAHVTHWKRESSRQRPVRTRFEFYRSMWRYYHEHHAHEPWILRGLVSGAILVLGTGAVIRRLVH